MEGRIPIAGIDQRSAGRTKLFEKAQLTLVLPKRGQGRAPLVRDNMARPDDGTDSPLFS
jgi:hypothetical protein